MDEELECTEKHMSPGEMACFLAIRAEEDKTKTRSLPHAHGRSWRIGTHIWCLTLAPLRVRFPHIQETGSVPYGTEPETHMEPVTGIEPATH